MIKISIWPFFTIFPDFWPHISKAVVNSFILMFNLSMFDKVQNLTIFDLFFAIFDPKTNFLVHFTLRYNFSCIEQDWNLTYIRDLWPEMTSGDLVTTFLRKLTSRASFLWKIYLILSRLLFEKLTARASFWYTIYPLSINFEIWL